MEHRVFCDLLSKFKRYLFWLVFAILAFLLECHQTCSTCAGPDPNQCTQCKKGLVLDPNTLFCGVTGDTDCPDGTYLHDDQFTCMGCHPECHSCEGPGENECQTCHIAKYLQSRHFQYFCSQISPQTTLPSYNIKTHKTLIDWLEKNYVKTNKNRRSILTCHLSTIK